MDDGFYAARYGTEMVPGAVIPPRLASPPPPPPPPSGAVPQRSTVDVTGATEALVVGPDEVLIVAFRDLAHYDYADSELDAIRERFRDTGLRDDQYILIAGDVVMSKVPRGAQPAYVRPQATIEGSAS